MRRRREERRVHEGVVEENMIVEENGWGIFVLVDTSERERERFCREMGVEVEVWRWNEVSGGRVGWGELKRLAWALQNKYSLQFTMH